MSAEQWLTFIGIVVALGMGILNWYDKRFPTKELSPLEESQKFLTDNQVVDLANKRALDAEIRAARAEEREQRLENLYNELRKEFEEWKSMQNYKITFSAQLGTNPAIMASAIYHDRRTQVLPYEGGDKRR